MTNLIKVEFHCHTCYSKDSLVSIDKLRMECLRKGIQRLVVTDHNNIKGAQIAHQLDPMLFIVGEEIMTTGGELLGIFVKENIPARLPPEETIEILRSQGAVISVAHPFDTMRSGHWDMENLISILPKIDAIEVFNSRCIDRQANKLAKEFAEKQQLLVTVGSDSHTLSEVGKSIMHLPDFNDGIDLKKALRTAEFTTRISSPWVHFYSSYARWKKRPKSPHKSH
jgi:predicted metal-dependent phosphoesterase TrpH